MQETEKIYLRPFENSDIENVFKGLSDPDIIKYYGVSFATLEATKEQMVWFAALENNRTGIWRAICSQADDMFLGAVGLNDWNKEHKKTELGYWLLPDNWGQGIISEAVPLMMNHAFNDMEIHRIEAYVEPENNNSKKVLTKFGFKLEGTMKDCEIKNGKFISLDIYAKLSAE